MNDASRPQAPPKRRLRNFLLDPRFQLKYTGMVVVVTVIIASVLGYFAYDFSKGQTESMNITALAQPDLTEEAYEDIMRDAEQMDQNVLFSIIGGIAFLAFALGVTGIIVTHKIVGPTYKLRRLIREVGEGKFVLSGALRKGDELQELFETFSAMVDSLRDAQAREVSELDDALEQARENGVPDSAMEQIIAVRDRMRATLD